MATLWQRTGALMLACVGVALVAGPSTRADEPAAGDPFAPLRQKQVLFNGWGLSPAGQHVQIGSMPGCMVLSPDGTRLLATSSGASQGLAVLDVVNRQQTQFVPLDRAFNGLCFSLDGKHVFVTGGNSDRVHCFDYADGKVTLDKTVSLTGKVETHLNKKGKEEVDDFLTGLAIQPATGDLYICAEGSNEVWMVHPQDLLNGGDGGSKVKATVRVGERPYACVFGADKRHLYVSNWGGRSVSVIDTQTQQVVRTIGVGIRPNDMAMSPDGRLFVACAGDNTVHVIQTRTLVDKPRETDQTAPPDETALEIISTALYPQSPEGSTPVGVAVSPDGKVLYVVNADNNDCVVADISDPKLAKVVGFIPTGWYPTAVAAYKDQVLIGNGKGLSSRENIPPRTTQPRETPGGPAYDLEFRIFQGWVSFVDRPDPAKAAEYTKQVRKNSPYTPETLRRVTQTPPKDSIIPARVGGDCPIKHILYIIKENRTYDQVFGDFTDAHGKPAGNGDPKLTLFGEKVTPNQHQLARDYVLLDNLYCNGEVSVDGHSWCDGAIATDGNQKTWITSYTQHGHLPGAKDIETPAAGYLWDHCQRNGVTFKCYGEGAGSVPNANRGTWPAGRDPAKAQGWIQDLQEAEKTGDLPTFMIMSLGENHTVGTTPGGHTPSACVASNDLAVGQIVEAATKSRFWKEMAIFIVEDDAQNGPDHVDSHRTVGLLISPYCKRGVVDSTPYSQVSLVRTIELILGLPPMTQYDAGATPMYNSFQPQCDPVAYAAKPEQVDLAAINAKDAPGAKASAEMDFSEYDEAPEDALNRVLWLAVKGPDEPYPTPVRRAVFVERE